MTVDLRSLQEKIHQRKWIEKRLKDIQENLEYCSISLRIEKGNITIFKKEKTELVPKLNN